MIQESRATVYLIMLSLQQGTLTWDTLLALSLPLKFVTVLFQTCRGGGGGGVN
jgi:hypothetical protein